MRASLQPLSCMLASSGVHGRSRCQPSGRSAPQCDGGPNLARTMARLHSLKIFSFLCASAWRAIRHSDNVCRLTISAVSGLRAMSIRSISSVTPSTIGVISKNSVKMALSIYINNTGIVKHDPITRKGSARLSMPFNYQHIADQTIIRGIAPARKLSNQHQCIDVRRIFMPSCPLEGSEFNLPRFQLLENNCLRLHFPSLFMLTLMSVMLIKQSG